jgi:hypothetical protein
MLSVSTAELPENRFPADGFTNSKQLIIHGTTILSSFWRAFPNHPQTILSRFLALRVPRKRGKLYGAWIAL